MPARLIAFSGLYFDHVDISARFPVRRLGSGSVIQLIERNGIKQTP